ANRLLRIVSGRLGTAAQMGLQGDTILIARNLGPAELLEYDRRRLKGVILEEGSLTAHVTIVARAMGVPMLGRVRNVRQAIAEGDEVLLDAAGEKPVVFRTVDIGGDKALPYLRGNEDTEENPALGWRALRLALERDALMKSQARALLEAAAGRQLQIMFPMVSEPWEFDV